MKNRITRSGMSNQGRTFAVLASLVLVLSGCVDGKTLDPSGEESFTNSWVKPDDAQEKIGQREHPVVVAKYGGEYSNVEAEKLLAVIVGKLISVSDDQARTYKITILNSPKVNAFALPGGYLYVTRGLLALTNDTAELAAVISHEMAHVSSDHAILRSKKQTSAEVGTEVVNEVLGDSVAGRVALAANQLRLADFSKDQELQADAVGIRMLGNAGFDPYAAARFLETMQAYQTLGDRGEGRLEDTSFLSSHPATPQRIDLARRHARMFGAPGIGDADRERYLKGVDGLLFGDSVEEGFVRNNRFSHLGLGITFAAPQASKLENQATSVVINGPGDIATRFDAAVLPKGISLEQYLKSGWVKGLDEASVTTSQTSGLPVARAVARGGQWDFVIRVIQLNRQVYRFITAGPLNGGQAEQTSAEIAGSFRELSDVEKAALQPLKIRIVTVEPSDTLATLSSRMKGTGDGLKMFQILNGFSAGAIPQVGSKVKIVTDQ
jgi:predicted Zn-dependent protease